MPDIGNIEFVLRLTCHRIAHFRHFSLRVSWFGTSETRPNDFLVMSREVHLEECLRNDLLCVEWV